MSRFVESVCLYCGCACKLNYEVSDNKVVKIHGVKSDDVSDGYPCIKGLTIHETYGKNVITKPVIRVGGLKYEVSLEKALNYIHEKTKNLSPDEVFFNTSGKITNENNYIIQKFARICYKTPNIDSCCTRLCHNSTVIAMKDVFGTPNITQMNNINDIDTLLIIGSEPEKDYPVFYNKIIKKNDLKVIRIHPFLTGCSENECVITIRPGSETCLLNGLINELIRKKIRSSAEGFFILKDTVKSYKARYVCNACGIKRKTYRDLVRRILKSGRLGIFHGMGLTQHKSSLDNVHSLLNLAVLKKATMLSLRGEVNVQGSGDLGGMPGILPTGDLSTKKDLEKDWGAISETKGLNMIESIILSPVKALFLTEFNPLKSLPDITQVREKLANTFIIYFGSHNNESSDRADVVIPIASILESDGTITNGERRLRKVSKVVNGQYELWEVLSKLSLKFRKSINFSYKNSKEIFLELSRLVKDYNGINADALFKGHDEWPNKKIRHTRFMPEHFKGIGYIITRNYPFVLTTYRSRYSFLGDEVTKGSETLTKMRSDDGFHMNPRDMTKLKIKEGDSIMVTSETSSLIGKAFESERIPKGMIGSYIHMSDLPINKLFPLKFDENSYTPNYKAVPVSVAKL